MTIQFENQFAPSNFKGTPATKLNFNIINCKVDYASINTLYGATAVKIVDTASSKGEITVEKASATDDIFGFVVFDNRKNTKIAGDNIDIAIQKGSNIMRMEAGAAIPAGSELEIVSVGDKVIVEAGNTIIGKALTKASASGDIIYVLIY